MSNDGVDQDTVGGAHKAVTVQLRISAWEVRYLSDNMSMLPMTLWRHKWIIYVFSNILLKIFLKSDMMILIDALTWK